MRADNDTQEAVLQDQQDEISEQEENEDKELDDELNVHEISKGGQRGVNVYRKLTTLVAVFAILIGFILSTYQATQAGKPKVVHANRYSKEHKFRPAASPIITETLKDGRVRIRGAEPTMSVTPTMNTKPKRKRKVAKKKASSKKAKVS